MGLESYESLKAKYQMSILLLCAVVTKTYVIF